MTDKTRIRHWHKAGFTRAGQKIPDRDAPKERLSEREANLLYLLQTHANTIENALPMRKMLEKYTETFKDSYLDSSLCSKALQQLKANWFAGMKSGKTAKVNKHTDETKTTKKAQFYLSDMAVFGRITIDPNRWVVFDGLYVAKVKTRLRVEESERRKDKALSQ